MVSIEIHDYILEKSQAELLNKSDVESIEVSTTTKLNKNDSDYSAIYAVKLNASFYNKEDVTDDEKEEDSNAIVARFEVIIQTLISSTVKIEKDNEELSKEVIQNAYPIIRSMVAEQAQKMQIEHRFLPFHFSIGD